MPTPCVRLKMLTAATVFAAATLCSIDASAQAAAPAPATSPRKFESSAGLKLLAGGNLWSTPSDVPKDASGANYDGLGFPGNGGGFGWGVAAYYEARFVQHLGLELDVGYDSSTLQRNVTYNPGGIKVTEKVTMSGLRWGFLAKGILPTPFGRIWLGLGPEFVSGSSVDASIDVKSAVANKAQIERLISAKSKSSTMLTFGFGLAIHIGDQLEIPVDLRAAKNLSQDSKWLDRVKVDPVTSEYEVTAQSSWDFRLATGLGYRF